MLRMENDADNPEDFAVISKNQNVGSMIQMFVCVYFLTEKGK